MQGKKAYQEKLFTSFQLSEYIPEDNFYRRLSQQLDLSFIYKLTASYYGNEGQKSVDPVVFMKLMLVGYLENITSDRRIIATSRLRLDILYFIGYDIDEELPWHSTLSRTRQLYGEHVFIELFKHVLKQCIDRGMVSGRRQAIDGFFVKANASLDSLVEKEILEDAISYSEELKANQENDEDNKIDVRSSYEQSNEGSRAKKSNSKVSNQTHYSPSDPESRISVKPGKPVALNYLGEVAVDTATHMITHIQAFMADKRDSECLPAMLLHTRNNLLENGIALEEIVADTGFSSGDALKALQAMKITGYIPNRTQFIYQRKEFPYYSEGDYYTCPNNKKLVYKGIYKDGNYYNKHYGLNKKDCESCSFSTECSARIKGKGARIKETVDRPYYERMHVRMQSKKARRLMKKRQSTVEPVIGTLVNYLGIKRVNVRGLAQANKCITLAAVAYNLKKMLKTGTNYIQQQQQELIKTKNKGLAMPYGIDKSFQFINKTLLSFIVLKIG